LIEMIGVLAIIAILAAVLVPSFVRQMDKVSGDPGERAAQRVLGESAAKYSPAIVMSPAPVIGAVPSRRKPE
jgi:competence protein ComGC